MIGMQATLIAVLAVSRLYMKLHPWKDYRRLMREPMSKSSMHKVTCRRNVPHGTSATAAKQPHQRKKSEKKANGWFKKRLP